MMNTIRERRLALTPLGFATGLAGLPALAQQAAQVNAPAVAAEAEQLPVGFTEKSATAVDDCLSLSQLLIMILSCIVIISGGRSIRFKTRSELSIVRPGAHSTAGPRSSKPRLA
jgi:hypothetical protein